MERRSVRVRPLAAFGAGIVALAAGAAGCEDGRHLFRGELEPGPVIPQPAQAATSPVGIFTVSGTALPAPTGPGYGAAGPAGIAIVPRDEGAPTNLAELEDTDALVCDPDNDRVLLLKSRDRSDVSPAPDPVTVFASLVDPRGVIVTEDRRALVATASGFAALDEGGGLIGAEHALANGPYRALALASGGLVLFLAGTAGVERVTLDASFAPEGAPALIHSSADVRALALRQNGDLLLVDGTDLLRIPSASSAGPGSAQTVFPFTSGDEPRAVVVNSAGNAVVAVEETGGGGRLDEIVVDHGTLLSPDGSVALAVAEAPRALAISGRQSAFFWTGATGAFVQIEAAPDLGERLVPFFEDRGCTGCHNGAPGFTVTPLDLTSAAAAFATLVGVPRDCTPPSGDRVAPGDPGISFLVEKLEPAPGCGVRMPQGLRPVPVVEVDIVRKWIESVATP